MRHLRLKRGLSYLGPGIRATKAAPDVFLEDDKTADAAIDSGYFEEVAGGDIVPPPTPPTGALEAIDTMGATKLRTYAKKIGLGLSWPTGTPADTIREDIRAMMKKIATEDEPPEELFDSGNTGTSGEEPPDGETGGTDGQQD